MITSLLQALTIQLLLVVIFKKLFVSRGKNGSVVMYFVEEVAS